MTFSIYQASVPVFIHGLESLATFLEKGRADAEARKFDPSVLIEARLAPDMLKLSRQVQIASDTAKNAGGRLAGVDLPSYPDTESNFEELQVRITKTIDYLGGLSEAQFEGSETREIVLKFPGQEMRFSGASYLTSFALPNFYFHLTTAFNILRHNGVNIGKKDFLGG